MLYVANWKMNQSLNEAQLFIQEIKTKVSEKMQDSFIFLSSPLHFVLLSKELNPTNFSWGGQNCFFENKGAYTGESSPQVMKEMGASYCLAGHSERRIIFKEDLSDVLKKTKIIIQNGMTPIVCVGENLEQRNKNQTREVLKSQLEGMKGLSPLIAAYEPVWAIGSSTPADPDQVQEALGFIDELCEPNKILYGGSVSAENVKSFRSVKNLDGFLIGGASLKVSSLLSIHQSFSSF